MSFFVDQKNATTALQDRASQGSKTGFGENFSAALDATSMSGLSVSDERNKQTVYGDIVRALNDGVSQTYDPTQEDRMFTNPYGWSSGESDRASTQRIRNSPDDLENKIWAEIDARRSIDPTALSDLPKDRKALREDIYKSVREAEAKANKVSGQAGKAGTTGQFVGNMIGVMKDPPIALSTLYGAGATASIFRTVIIEGLLGAGSEAVVQPDIQRYRAEAGLDPQDELTNIAVAGAGAAVFGGLLKGAGRVVGRLGRNNVVRMSNEKLLKIFDDLVKKPTAEQRAARENLSAEVDLEKDNPLAGREGQAEHRARTAEAVQAAEAGVQPSMDARPKAPLRPQNFDHNLDGLVSAFNPDDLKVDAKLFQFKDGGDAVGVTDRLHGVTGWDPVKAGQVLVYEFADGRKFIADGHQRLALAKRIKAQNSGQDVRLIGQVLRESDGVTPEMARVVAAMKNIAEGSGAAIDAAKVLRVDPNRIDELPPRSELVRQAQSLANLSDDAFGMVVNEVIPAHFAAIVGRLIKEDPALQSAVMGVLSKTRPENVIQAESIVRQAMDAGTHTEIQVGLFGEEMLTKSLFAERAKVLDRAMKRLRKDKGVFKSLVSNSNDIAKAGNRLADSENLKRVSNDENALQTLQTLANRKGPLSDALTTAASRAADDGNFGEATREFVRAVRDAASRGDFEGATIGGAGRIVDAEAKSPARPGDEQADLNMFSETGGEGVKAQTHALERDATAKRQETAEMRGDTGSSTPSLASRSAEAGGAINTAYTSMDEPLGSGDHRPSAPSQDTMRAPPSSVFSSRATTPLSHLGTNIELGDINLSSNNRIYHSVDDFNALHARAEDVAPALDAYLQEVVQSIPGAEFAGVRVKDATEMKAKIESKGRIASEVSDYLGGRIVVDDWTALTAVLHDLKSTGRAFEIEDMLDIPRESGYRAIHLQLFEDGGLSAEIQIQPRELREAQEQVHDAYSKWRRRDDLTPAAFEEASRVGAESQAIFTKAWQKFTDRAGPRPDADAKIPVGLAADAADGELSALTRNVNDVLDDLEAETTFIDDMEGKCVL